LRAAGRALDGLATSAPWRERKSHHPPLHIGAGRRRSQRRRLRVARV